MTSHLPAPLRRALQEAEVALDASPSGHLPLRHRRPIWEALGEYGPTHPPSPGHYRRAVLDLLAIEHVTPVWDEGYPGDPAVERVLEAARRMLADGFPIDEAQELAGEAFVEFTDRMGNDGMFGPGYVGEGVCAALMTATRDKSYAALPPGVDDEDLDVEDWDASFFAELAASGEPDDPSVDPEARRRFWRWYLEEAVPAAWASAPG